MTTLRQASNGLVYVSEIDHPFQPVHWPKEVTENKPIEPDRVRRLAGLPASLKTATQELDEFLRPLVTMEEWYEEEDRELVRRYQHLMDSLQEILSDITVIKFGQFQMEVFIVGHPQEGGIAGLRTKAAGN